MRPVRDHKSWYTYVLQSTTSNQWYTGVTNDLRKRFKQHQAGKSSSTRGRGPFRVMYYEMCKNQDDVRSRELYLKSGMGKRYLKNRLRRFLPARQSLASDREFIASDKICLSNKYDHLLSFEATAGGSLTGCVTHFTSKDSAASGN